MLAAVHIVKG